MFYGIDKLVGKATLGDTLEFHTELDSHPVDPVGMHPQLLVKKKEPYH